MAVAAYRGEGLEHRRSCFRGGPGSREAVFACTGHSPRIAGSPMRRRAPRHQANRKSVCQGVSANPKMSKDTANHLGS